MTPRPHGLVLPLVLLMLSSLSALLVARQLWLQERLLRVQAEQLRQQHLAEGVLALAVQDITAPATRDDGSPNPRQQRGEFSPSVFFPTTLAERELLRERLGAAPCREGLCVTDSHAASGQPLASPSWADWLARQPDAMPVAQAQWPRSAARGWYWIEVLVDATAPSDSPRFFYRITALVQGGLPGAQVMLQAVWQRDAVDSRHGRWSGWHLLSP